MSGASGEVASSISDVDAKKIINEFTQLLEKSKQLFNGLRFVAFLINCSVKIFINAYQNCLNCSLKQAQIFISAYQLLEKFLRSFWLS